MCLTLPPRLRRKGGTRVGDAMRAFLEKQKESGFVGTHLVDTMRVCLPQDVDFEKLVFAAGELLQNQGDASKDALAAGAALAGRSHAPVRQVKNGLEWMLGDEVAMGVYFTERGVQLFQFGRPIPIDACASGTQAKKGGQGKTGGYGDGMKTAANDIVAFGYDLQFAFRGYDEEKPRSVMHWRFRSEVPENFHENHLVVRIEEEGGADGGVEEPESEFAAELPTMVSEVTAPDPERVATLHSAFAAALRRFQWLLYEEVEDPEGRTVSAEGWGSWRHACTFSPVVDYISSDSGPTYSLRFDPERARFLVGGVFYQARSMAVCMPPTLVIEVPGRGIRHDPPSGEFKVFRNQLRDLDDSLGVDFVVLQMAAFLGAEGMEKRLTEAFLPLLEGGSSLLLVNSHGGNLTHHLLNRFSAQLRERLLFRKLLPKKASAAQKQRTREVCRSAICAAKADSSKVKYLKKIIDGGLVVVVDENKVNTRVFQLSSPWSLQYHAARAAVTKAAERASGFHEPSSSMKPAILYVSSERVTAVRVSFAPGDFTPYHFRSEDTIVYFSPLADTVRTVPAIFPPLFRNTEEEGRRCVAFQLHFQDNAAQHLSLGKRVKYAIEAAKKNKEYNIGEGKRRKPGDSSDSSSDSSDDERPAKRPKAQNKPQPAAPPAGLRSAGVGLSNPPASSSAAPDPLPQKFVCQEWSDELGMFVPAGEPAPKLSQKMKVRLSVFHAALEQVLASQEMGRCVVYASWSKGADWEGIHYSSSGLCLVNLALSKQSKAERAVVIMHELSHERAHSHDVAFVGELQQRVASLLSRLL